MQATLSLPVPFTPPALLVPPAPLPLAPTPSIITVVPMLVFGLDQGGRPHAAYFTEHDPAAVERVGDLGDFFVVAADTDVLRDLGARLPAGRLFASGRGFVPYCKASIYEQLLDAAGHADAPRPLKAASKAAEAGGSGGGGQGSTPGGAGAGDPPATRVGAKAPNEWSEIGLGSVVLAHDEEDGGFYAAKIMTTKAHDSFTLKWAFFPDLPEFSRARRELALMHPETVAKLA